MTRSRTAFGSAVLSCLLLAACSEQAPHGGIPGAPTPTPTTAPSGTPTTAPSGTPTTAPSGTPTTAPSGTPTTAPSGTPTTQPTATPTPLATATPAPTATPTPTPVPTTAPVNTLSIDQPTVTLCAPLEGNVGEGTYGCANASLQAASVVVVHTVGVTGQLVATSKTGVAVATVIAGSGTGYPEVAISLNSSGQNFLTGTDSITIKDTGTGNVATVPVTAVQGGNNGTGAITGTGYINFIQDDQFCAGTSGTFTAGNSTGSAITATSNNPGVATIAPSGAGFAYSYLTGGSTYYTLSAGGNIEIVPINLEIHLPGANLC